MVTMSVAQKVSEDPDLVKEIPDDLKKLAKYVMRGFYTIEHVLIVDLLVRNVIMKDDDLADLLKFDKKHLRSMLNKLKSDKLLKSTLRVETQADGKTNRHNYYFINYKVFVNVVKYKLDKMRQKIESRERESTCKALYKCVNCDKQYNEYDTGDLIDFMSGEMKCTLCGSEVIEDETVAPEKDTYMQIALFNEQMRPLFDLLKEVEHIKLAPEVLEPTPVIANENTRTKQYSSSQKNQAGWSASSRPDYDLYNQQVTINMGDESKNGETGEKKEVKERPVWMVGSTVDGAISEPDSVVERMDTKQAGVSTKGQSHDKEEIMMALLVHERKAGTQPQMSAALSDNESDESASDDDFPTSSIGRKEETGLYRQAAPSSHIEMDDDEDDEEEEVMISVRGQSVPFSEVTSDHVAEMTPMEKEIYIKLAQEAYAAMHD
ncbi:General transcription factor IIE subunit 1 [Holothuria leucospilota]|uniref:General transcription factor IIE subunit 1 n=1 Tax=Holothuria leucospilota TaxID=206669 RepID=A0A9Q1GZ45_HOLLE|nr:General transcription factor IIE subunit 1 [Holothuria leucospilota]